MSALRTDRLSKSFGSLRVSEDITLTVEVGERHMIIGPNGAGKTTFIHQLCGQLRPDVGRIFLDEKDVTYLAPEERCMRGLARTFQRNNLFRDLSVEENVRLAARRRGGRPMNPISRSSKDAEVNRRAHECLEMVRLADHRERIVSSLSYGEQRQLEIAVALACEPKVLLLDEPTSGMSPVETERTMALIGSLPRELGILMVEHDMNVVFTLADKITVLYYGQVLATGTPDEISKDSRVHDVYLGRKKRYGHA